MSIASEITRLQGAKNTLKTKLNAKNDAQHQIDDETLDEYGDFVDSIPTGGGGGAVEEKDVNFYDYDGTLLYSYTKTDFLALTEMPENPTHTGLTAQGWNWDLTDAKTYVTDYGILDVGQVYTTASGLSEFDIELNAVTGLSVTLNMNGTKNWGDGTSDTTTSHTYANAGKYTISCNGTTMNTSTASPLVQVPSCLKFARITGITRITEGAFQSCKNMKNITISNSITDIQAQICGECYSLEIFIMPKNITTLNNAICAKCYSLKKFIFKNISSIGSGLLDSCYKIEKNIIPSNITDIGQLYRSCYSVKKVIMPEATTTISAYCFYYAHTLVIYDFRHLTQVPTLSNKNAFSSINNLAKIVVPDSLYNDWISETNWSIYADYIVKESDYNAS